MGRDEFTSLLSLLISQNVNRFLETAKTVASFRSRFRDNHLDFFQQAFGHEPACPELLEIFYRPTGIYFVIGREDFNCLYTGKNKESIYGFASSGDKFTSFPELKRRVGIAKKATQETRTSREVGKYTIEEIVEHEENHLLYYQFIGWPANIKESTVRDSICNSTDLDKQRELLAEIKNSIVIGLVMEHAAYGGVNGKFSISPDASGRTDWKDYFSYLRIALGKYHPQNTAAIRELWLETYTEYLKEDRFIHELASYMMEEVAVIDKIPNLVAGESLANKKETRSNLPKDIGELVFTLMVPQAQDRLLQGLGFSSREEFLNYLKEIEVSVIHKGGLLDRPLLFDIQILEEDGVQRIPTEVVTLEDLGLRQDMEKEYTPPPASRLGSYLEFLWNGGKDALVLDSRGAVNKQKSGPMVEVRYELVLYLGEPISFGDSQIDDGSLFLNLHLPEVLSVSAEDIQGDACLLKSIRRCLGAIAHSLKLNSDGVEVVTAASNTRLIGVLTRSFGFNQVDYLPEGKMTAKIREIAFNHDKTSGEEIEGKLCPVAVTSVREFVARFERYYVPPVQKRISVHEI